MKKSEREKVFNKYGGKCAYCGCDLQKGWHVDHVEPIGRYWKYRREPNGRILTDEKGSYLKDFFVSEPDRDHIDNMMPACRRCNGWKSTFSIEQFRDEILEQVKRARAYSCNFRMAEDFGLVEVTNKPVIFYFELLNSEQELNRSVATMPNSSNGPDKIPDNK